MSLLRFKDALGKVPKGSHVHVLLGNGFSQAWRSDIFSYGALFDRADFKKLSPLAREAFGILKTTDFERVMRALRDSSVLIKLYERSADKVAKAMQDDAEGLREVLVSAIAGSHPEMPNAISDTNAQLCRAFLANFEHIYTLNYDLLLYWVLMRDELKPEIMCDDGFRSPEDKEAEYVTWEPENVSGQNIHYLHGALHIFDAGVEIQKYTWKRTGVRLIDQIREALKAERYPLFVAEGSSNQKYTRIRHSDYLSRAFRSLLGIGGALFVFGVSFSEADAHIIRAIHRARSKISELFVSVHGDPAKPENAALINSAKIIAQRRGIKNPLNVYFFDASSANVWG